MGEEFWPEQFSVPSLNSWLSTRICRGPCWEAGEGRGGIGPGSGTPPHVTGHHGEEGADARSDRITHPAAARLWGLRLDGGRGAQHADAVGAPDGPDPVLRVWGLRHLGARRAQLAGAPAPGSPLGDVDGLAGGGRPPRTLPSLWGPHRTGVVRGGQ